MLDINKIYEESFNELTSLGIPVNKAEVKLAPLNEKTGYCYVYPDRYEIKIMKAIVSRDDYHLTKKTMIHELLHTCKDTKDHDKKWQEYARIAEDYGHYGLFESDPHSLIHGENLPVKKIYFCPDCGVTYKATKIRVNTEIKCPWCKKHMEEVTICDIPEE